MWSWTGALPQAWAQPQPKMIKWHAHVASTAAAIRAHALRMCRPWELAGHFASVVMVVHVQLALPNERLSYYVLGCIRGKQLKASSLPWWVANNVDQGWVYGLHWYIYKNKSEAVDVHKNYCFWMFSFYFPLCFLVGSYSKLDKNQVSTWEAKLIIQYSSNDIMSSNKSCVFATPLSVRQSLVLKTHN